MKNNKRNDKSLLTLFRNNRTFLKEFWRRGKLYIFAQIVMTILGFPVNYLYIYAPKMFLDCVTEQGNLKLALIWIGSMIAVSIVWGLFWQWLECLKQKAVMYARLAAKAEFSRGINQYYLSYFDDPKKQDIISRAQTYSESGGAALITLIVDWLNLFVNIATVTYVSFQFDWWIWVLMVGAFFARMGIGKWRRVKNRKFERAKTIRDRKIGYLASAPVSKANMPEIRLYNSVDFWVNRYRSDVIENYRLYIQHLYQMSFVGFWEQLPERLLNFFSYVSIGTRLIAKTSTIGDYSLFFSMIGQVNGIFYRVGNLYNTTMQQAIQSQYYTEFVEDTDSIMPVNENSVWPDRIDDIEFKNMSFRYPGQQKWALQDISLKIRRGERITIIGYNGAGKTTLIKLLLNLYQPIEGEILVNGRPVTDYNNRGYWDHFGAIFQDHHMYALNVAENIVLNETKPEDMPRVWEVLEKVNLKRKIQQTADALETEVTRNFDPGGLYFSGGEIQKFAIARMLFKDCDFMILDEPSSALDPAAEDELYQVIDRVSKDKTVIMISHRLSSVMVSDRVLFFKDGKIIGDGPHDTLMKTCPEYEKLFMLQAKRYQEKKTTTSDIVEG